MTGKVCAGTSGCGAAGANPICAGVCALHGALATTCTAVPMDIRVAGDYKLGQALKAHSDELTALMRQAHVISSNLGGVLDRSAGQFKTIGVVYDNARFCSETATPIYDEARSLAGTATAANGVFGGISF
jgi:hypothetical protein